LLAYYDLKTDRLYGYVTKHKKTPDFLRFLKWVRRRYPVTQKLHLVMDNYGTHIRGEVARWARGQQCAPVLHTDERIVAEPHRVSLRPAEEVRVEQLGPPQPPRTGSCN